MKKLIISLMLIAVLVASCTVVYGYTNISNYTQCYFYSSGYSSATGTLKVLNVYTSGTPSAGTSVTIYSYSGSNTQKWEIIDNVDISSSLSGTYRVVTMALTTLALNYNQSTTKCTVYYFDPLLNSPNDYAIGFNTASGGYTIWLCNRPSRYLGNSGSSNGSQCYWYTVGNNGVGSEDIWIML